MNIIKLRLKKIGEDLIIPIEYEGIIKIKVFDGNKIIYKTEVISDNIIISNEILNTIESETFKLFIEGDVTEFYDYNKCFRKSLIEVIDINSESLTHLRFQCCKELEKVNITSIPNVNNFDYMFYYCPNLRIITNIDTSNGIDFSYMFYYCTELKSIPLFDTSKGKRFDYMFYRSQINPFLCLK